MTRFRKGTIVVANVFILIGLFCTFFADGNTDFIGLFQFLLIAFLVLFNVYIALVYILFSVLDAYAGRKWLMNIAFVVCALIPFWMVWRYVVRG